MSLAIIINILNRVVIDNDDDNGDRDDDDILIYNLNQYIGIILQKIFKKIKQ